MIKLFLIFIFIGFLSFPAFCQDTRQLLEQVAQTYTGSNELGLGKVDNGLIAGFSSWGLIGMIIFSGIGFIAFMYGKKNSEFQPMIVGIVLMVYPYFIRGTGILYLAGIALTALLYFWRE